jgi:carboxypeptidase Taq
MTFETRMAEVRRRLQDLSDLGGIGALLGWDQSTYQPPAAGAGRARQQALLARMGHAQATDPELGRLLDGLEAGAGHLGTDSLEARLLRVARRDYDRAIRLPGEFVGEFSQHAGETYEAWTRARPANDFAGMVPRLEKTLDLTRRYAAYSPEFAHPMDLFIDESDEGMTMPQVRQVFDGLRDALVPLVAQVTAAPAPRTDFLYREYPQEAQLAFGASVAADFGYDLARGRQDLTHHPFMTRLGHDDIRITTRVKPNDLTEALFSTLHETGHALYEQGTAAEFAGTPLDGGTSSGVHESQSRLWENVVGRSLPFWQHYFPRLQALFPEQLRGVSVGEFYRAVNAVSRSLIRTDADELTYNLHVITRFGLELDLLDGKLEVRDLADAWHAAYQDNLGLHAPDDRDGVLQDVHWYGGSIGGAFQGYTIGNVLSAQFFEAACRAHPEIPGQLGRGEFGTLLGWLQQNVYRHGRSRTPGEVVQLATGQAMTALPYLAYLKGKYSALYPVVAT